MVSLHHYQPQRHDRLTASQSISILYHDVFGYPLKEKEFTKWAPGKNLKLITARPRMATYNGYYFLLGKEEIVLRREENEASSREKMKLLSAYRRALEEEGNVLFAGITGSLAMNSASAESDIDLMVITKANTLWQTRLKVLLKLRRLKIDTRRAGKSEQANKLCINMWMDESNLKVENKNPYTAHELAQIVPLINRGGSYDRLLSENRWILDYWPNSVEIKELPDTKVESRSTLKEWIAYRVQKLYMKSKMTREVVTPTRAFFHPMDWSRRVAVELKKRGVEYV